MTDEERWRKDTEVRFVPYDCSACFECWQSKQCIYARFTRPQSPEEIAKCRDAERSLLEG